MDARSRHWSNSSLRLSRETSLPALRHRQQRARGQRLHWICGQDSGRGGYGPRLLCPTEAERAKAGNAVLDPDLGVAVRDHTPLRCIEACRRFEHRGYIPGSACATLHRCRQCVCGGSGRNRPIHRAELRLGSRASHTPDKGQQGQAARARVFTSSWNHPPSQDYRRCNHPHPPAGTPLPVGGFFVSPAE